MAFTPSFFRSSGLAIHTPVFLILTSEMLILLGQFHTLNFRRRSMLQKMTFVFLAVFTVGMASGQEAHKAWAKLLEGEWTYDITNPDEKGSVVYSIAADGAAVIGRFKSEASSPAIELGGWRAKTKTYSVSGYGADGSYWQIDFTAMTPDKAEGPHVSVNDGSEYKGMISLKKVNENQFEWTSSGTDGNGNQVVRNGMFKRKVK
jgi:hypothetical protein